VASWTFLTPEPGGRERTIGELLDLLTGTGTDRGA
jgi:hypothetical protein